MTIKADTIRDLSARFRAAGAVQTTDDERRELPRELRDVVSAVRTSGHADIAVCADRALTAPMNEVDLHLGEILRLMHDKGLTEI
jgi:hypothetical protein